MVFVSFVLFDATFCIGVYVCVVLFGVGTNGRKIKRY